MYLKHHDLDSMILSCCIPKRLLVHLVAWEYIFMIHCISRNVEFGRPDSVPFCIKS